MDGEKTVYLIEKIDDEPHFKQWLKLNWEVLFEEEQHGWYVTPELWPQDRTRAPFDRWCDVEYHTVVEDRGTVPLIDDEM